jgi:hypothetical protein
LTLKKPYNNQISGCGITAPLIEEVVIRRRKGDMFSIAPKLPPTRSPFDVLGLNKKITRKEILEAIRESRERA